MSMLCSPFKLKCFHKKQTGGQEVIFRVQFHTSAVQDYQLVLAKRDLDEAYKDKRFPESAKVEVIFSQYVETDKGSRGDKHSDIRHSLLDGHENRLFTSESIPRSDSYEDFRKIDETVHSTQEDLIQLDSPVPSPKSIRRVPGPSNESLYTVVDTSAKKKNSPVFDRRSLPTPPQEGQDQMASKVGFVS
jgi:hypothetical protein